MSEQGKLYTPSDVDVYLAMESLFQRPLERKLIRLGYNSKGFELWSDEMLLPQTDSTNVVILQADLWSGIKNRLDNSTSKIFIGPPSFFHNWEDTKGEKVAGYITPYDSPGVISDSIVRVLQGRRYLSNVMKQFLSRRSKSIQEELLNVRLRSHLTKSELEILVSIGEGYTTCQIAESRIRSIHTVKTQRKKVRWKLGFDRGVRLGNFAGREIDVLKTLLFIQNNDKAIRAICKNTT